MCIPWTRLALVFAACLSATSAKAVNFDPTNHTTRQIRISVEDHPCANTTSPSPPSAAPASCFVWADNASAIYTDPSNDYYGTISYVGVSAATGGTSSFQITVPTRGWATILTKPPFNATLSSGY